MQKILGASLVALALGVCGPALAQSADWVHCTNADASFAPAVTIAGCTRIIDAGQDTTENLAIAYDNRGIGHRTAGDYAAARADHDQAIALNPALATAWDNRGASYAMEGQNQLAIENYNEAIRLSPKFAGAYRDRALAYSAMGDDERAIADLTQALAMSPGYVDAHNDFGQALTRRRDFAGAITHYDAAIAANPRFGFAYTNRGDVYFQQGDYTRAIADHTAALAIDPNMSLALGRRGDAYYAMQNWESALADYDAGVKVTPQYAYLHNLACWTRAARLNRELERARQECDEAIRLENHASFFDSRGLLNLKEGRFQDAWFDYDAAMRGNPNSGQYRYGRGIAALRLGRELEGRADLTAATAADAGVAERYASYGVTP